MIVMGGLIDQDSVTPLIPNPQPRIPEDFHRVHRARRVVVFISSSCLRALVSSWFLNELRLAGLKPCATGVEASVEMHA
jgi:hypothetical protein